MKTISQILEFLGIQTSLENNYQIKSLYLDSRKCDSKSAFIALEGLTTDGNEYVENVLAKGVKLILSDKLPRQSSIATPSVSEGELPIVVNIENLKYKLSALAKWFYDYKKPQNIIGITGTNGKTSISNYIAQVVKLCNQRALLLGTNGNGIYPNLVESTHTTLDILSLYQMISKELGLGSHNSDSNLIQLDSGSESGMKISLDNLVMEVSSHALDQKRVEGLKFDIAVFSNLSHDHLDYHVTMDNYFQAKTKLFEFDSLKKAVINMDDKYGQKLCSICKCEIIKVSLQSETADIFLKDIKVEGIYTSFDLYIYQEYIGRFTTRLIAEFNLTNLALAIGALYGQLPVEKILDNIPNIIPVKGRMEVMNLANGAKVVIDYAHTPDALEKALQTLKNYTENKLWCVFGCGGDRDTTKRAEMANMAGKCADRIVVTEDNSRFESIDNIFKDIREGFSNLSEIKFIESREEAIEFAIKEANCGDIILLAGKGHECYLDRNGIKEYFDEREIIAKYNF